MRKRHGIRNKPGRPRLLNEELEKRYYKCSKIVGGVSSCDAKFLKSSKLKEHIIVEHGGFKCTICEGTFKAASKLNSVT